MTRERKLDEEMTGCKVRKMPERVKAKKKDGEHRFKGNGSEGRNKRSDRQKREGKEKK